jgi:hypothetical protein
MWAEYEQAAFPDECRGSEDDGVDLVLLGADLAGCVSTYVSRGTLNARRLAVLTNGAGALKSKIPQLGSEASVYFSILRNMADIVLAGAGGQA